MPSNPCLPIATVALAVVAGLASGGPARASSDDAWAEFSAAVEQKCLSAVGGAIEKPVVVVDPSGSERFGLALVTGTPPKMKQPVSYICVLDKETGAVELGSELSSDMLTITVAPK
ncbi:MAG: hypothetical protein ACOH2J_03255 [Allorhizobium sp.]